jgi:hypothetical protein
MLTVHGAFSAVSMHCALSRQQHMLAATMHQL